MARYWIMERVGQGDLSGLVPLSQAVMVVGGLASVVLVLVGWLKRDAEGKRRVFGHVYDARGKRMPGPWNTWPLGYLVAIKKHRQKNEWHKAQLQLFEQYGPVLGMKIGTMHVAFVADPACARVVVTGPVDDLPKGVMYKKLGLLPGGLLTASGDEWRHDRKLLHGPFSYDCIKGMVPIFNQHATNFIRHLAQEKQGEMASLFCRLTLDIIVHAGFGVPTNAVSKGMTDDLSWAAQANLTEITQRLKDVIPIARYRPTRVWRHYKSTQILRQTTHKVMKDKQQGSREMQGTLMDLMLEATEGGEWNLKKLLAQSMTFLLAGHETTAATLGWVLLDLSRNPRVLEKLRMEVDSVLGASTRGGGGGQSSEVDGVAGGDTGEGAGDGVGGPTPGERNGSCSSNGSSTRNRYVATNGHVAPTADSIPATTPTTNPTYDVCVTSAHIEAMPYLRCVLKESLRLHPPVVIFSRLARKPLQLGEWHIPEGWNVALSIYALHMSEKLWERPRELCPERWEGKGPLKTPFQYMPFSMGPRDCIGQRFALMEASVVVARMVHELDWELTESPVSVHESVTVKPARLQCNVALR